MRKLLSRKSPPNPKAGLWFSIEQYPGVCGYIQDEKVVFNVNQDIAANHILMWYGKHLVSRLPLTRTLYMCSGDILEARFGEIAGAIYNIGVKNEIHN